MVLIFQRIQPNWWFDFNEHKRPQFSDRKTSNSLCTLSFKLYTGKCSNRHADQFICEQCENKRRCVHVSKWMNVSLDACLPNCLSLKSKNVVKWICSSIFNKLLYMPINSVDGFCDIPQNFRLPNTSFPKNRAEFSLISARKYFILTERSYSFWGCYTLLVLCIVQTSVIHV